MSGAENIAVVRAMFEAYRERGSDGAGEFLHPDVEYDVSMRPDGRVWHGREGARAALLEWTETWDDFELEVEDYLDAGERGVAVLWREQGRAKASGVALSQAGVMVCTMRDGLVATIAISHDPERTLRELGLAPKPRV